MPKKTKDRSGWMDKATTKTHKTTPATGHTPGPWGVTTDLAAMRAPYSMVVATFDCMGQHKHIICTGVTAANAHLIAAAPETAAERDRLLVENGELKKALHKIAWEPIGEADATDTEILNDIEKIAKAALAKK